MTFTPQILTQTHNNNISTSTNLLFNGIATAKSGKFVIT